MRAVGFGKLLDATDGQLAWKFRAALIVLSALLFYLHYTAILILAGETAFLAVAPWLLARRRRENCLLVRR